MLYENLFVFIAYLTSWNTKLHSVTTWYIKNFFLRFILNSMPLKFHWMSSTSLEEMVKKTNLL